MGFLGFFLLLYEEGEILHFPGGNTSTQFSGGGGGGFYGRKATIQHWYNRICAVIRANRSGTDHSVTTVDMAKGKIENDLHSSFLEVPSNSAICFSKHRIHMIRCNFRK